MYTLIILYSTYDKVLGEAKRSPAAGAAAPPEPALAELATATAPPAGTLASLP